MLDWSHGSAYPNQIRGDAQNRDLTFTDFCADTCTDRRVSVQRRLPDSPARFGRSAVAGAAPDSALPCGGAVSDRLRKMRAADARRSWIERQGETGPTTPVWVSRDAWIEDVRGWAVSPDFAPLCASVGVSITSATVVAVAVLWAGSADHGTGRHAALTRARIAEKMGCAIKTVSRAWKVLGAAGWAVEVARGHGSSSGHTAGNRPSIWHLVSRRPAVPEAADPVENVPLPPKAGSCLLSPVGNYSPSVRERAREEISPTDHTARPRSRRRYRATPRPLAVQRLAAGLVTPAVGRGPDNHGRRTALIAGLERAHLGSICDAITSAGIDATAWTPKTLAAALNADMQARGWSWPDRIERPGALLAARLRRLPARPDTTPIDGGTAAGLEQDRRSAVAPVAAPVAVVEFTATERARITAARLHARRVLTEHQQRRAADTRQRRAVAVPVRQSAPAAVPEAGTCATCGTADAPRRRFMPPHRSHVCDACWAAPDQSAGA